MRVYERGARVSGPNLVLFGIPSGAGECRLGITATRKCGGAVIRNLLKRRLREVFRSMRHEIPVAMDLVVNVRRGADTVPFGRLRDEMARLSLELARKVSR